MVQKASVKKDTQLKEFAKNVMAVPKEIKKYVIWQFVKQCFLLHNIAFHEYRMHVSETTTPTEEL